MIEKAIIENEILSSEYVHFLSEIKKRVQQSRYIAARSVNSEMIKLYYFIGQDILKRQETDGWGSKVIDRLSKDLSEAFPDMKGFSSRNLKRMRLFAQEFSESTIVPQVVEQLPWGHIVYLMEFIKNLEERVFYIKKASENGWSRAVMVQYVSSSSAEAALAAKDRGSIVELWCEQTFLGSRVLRLKPSPRDDETVCYEESLKKYGDEIGSTYF